MPRVYVGKLTYHVREKDILRFFSGYGKLLEIDLKNGYGFVEFEDMRDADDAVYELNGKELCGERVVIEHARGPKRDGNGGRSSGNSSWNRTGRDKYGPPVRTEHRIIVENLSSRCSWQDLKDFMRQAGEVTYADAHKGRANEGVIEFRSRSDLKRALEKLDGTDINGRKIRLLEDKPRHKRSYSGSRSRSRSRRGTHSHSRRSGTSHSRSRSRSRSQSRSKRWSHSGSRWKSGSRSKRKSRSKTPKKSRSHTRKPQSPSKKTQSRTPSCSESRNKKHPSKSPPGKDSQPSKHPAKRSASSSRSRSRSRSASQN
ncbi:serine/arginine-rich splicing factor 6-like [Centropristis striata]|uniref:serine/arginine-rich splicing factor 6-like n=1 Tax=Centropristis striata TaxID=184440 RepID=UPI0027E12E0A|nr:serine/arginine-rich splicing factor 6-like [Centropristis striata]